VCQRQLAVGERLAEVAEDAGDDGAEAEQARAGAVVGGRLQLLGEPVADLPQLLRVFHQLAERLVVEAPLVRREHLLRIGRVVGGLAAIVGGLATLRWTTGARRAAAVACSGTVTRHDRREHRRCPQRGRGTGGGAGGRG
jgi:hypothetical protein